MTDGPIGLQQSKPCLSIIGQVRLTDSAGGELPLRDQTTRAILALLAQSPGHTRARQGLRAMLWPDRAPAQSAGSLRTDLYKIGTALEPWPEAFTRDRATVRLDPAHIDIDIESFDPAVWAGRWGRTPPTLMEDLDLDGPFEEWRREQQAIFNRRFEAAIETSDSLRPLYALEWQATPLRPCVIVLPAGKGQSSDDFFATTILRETLVRCLCEIGTFDVTEDATGSVGSEIVVDTRVLANSVIVVLTLHDRQSGMRIWSATRQFRGGLEDFSSTSAFRLFVNELCWAVARHWAGRYVGSDDETVQALAAVNLMFKLGHAELARADRMLASSFEREQRPMLLAWRAYLRTFHAGENTGRDPEAVREEARSFATRAIEMEPSNSMVLALSSYVFTFVLKNRHFGYDLAERAVTANAANPLALAYLGRAKSYFGDHEAGYDLTSRARAIAGPSPFRYIIDFMCGITALLSGRQEEALRLGETSLAQAPDYQAPQRYLIPLHLKTGNMDRAREILGNMKRLDPDFSIAAMRENAVPVAGAREAGLLDYTDSDLL